MTGNMDREVVVVLARNASLIELEADLGSDLGKGNHSKRGSATETRLRHYQTATKITQETGTTVNASLVEERAFSSVESR